MAIAFLVQCGLPLLFHWLLELRRGFHHLLRATIGLCLCCSSRCALGLVALAKALPVLRADDGDASGAVYFLGSIIVLPLFPLCSGFSRVQTLTLGSGGGGVYDVALLLEGAALDFHAMPWWCVLRRSAGAAIVCCVDTLSCAVCVDASIQPAGLCFLVELYCVVRVDVPIQPPIVVILLRSVWISPF